MTACASAPAPHPRCDAAPARPMQHTGSLQALLGRNQAVLQNKKVGAPAGAAKLASIGMACNNLGFSSQQVLADSPHVLTLRDRNSVAELAARLPAARKVVLVGNGGIALELAHALRGVEVHHVKFPTRKTSCPGLSLITVRWGSCTLWHAGRVRAAQHLHAAWSP